MPDRADLRPLERAVLSRQDEGLGITEIARRFRRSPGHIERIISYADLPRGASEPAAGTSRLRPLERRVLRLVAEGSDYDQLAAAFRRSASHMRRITGLAHLRAALGLLR